MLGAARPPSRKPKASIRKRCLRTSLLCAILYLLVCVGCATFQRRLIYFPPNLTAAQVEESGRSEGLERWQDSAKQIGWKRPSRIRPPFAQVLIMHGNADCACQCGHYADVLQRAAALDVFILEYPGYGGRPGTPAEQSLDAAASEALELLPANCPVYLVGESLGTGVAACLAGRCPERVRGIALLAPYTSLADVGQAHMPIIPVRLLLRDRFPAQDCLTNYHGAVAVLVAGRDKVVPERFGRRLYDGYSGPKRLWKFPEMDHETIMFQPVEVWKQIVSFWRSAPAD